MIDIPVKAHGDHPVDDNVAVTGRNLRSSAKTGHAAKEIVKGNGSVGCTHHQSEYADARKGDPAIAACDLIVVLLVSHVRFPKEPDP